MYYCLNIDNFAIPIFNLELFIDSFRLMFIEGVGRAGGSGLEILKIWFHDKNWLGLVLLVHVVAAPIFLSKVAQK